MKKAKPNVMKKMQESIIDMMEKHGDDWTQCWIGTGIPTNIKTKKYYKGGNACNLGYATFVNKWQCNEWGTFKQWNDLGYKIKKGSKGNHVYYWELRDKKVSWLTEGEKAKYLATKKLPTYLLQRFATVFNGEQIEDFSFETFKGHKTVLNQDDIKMLDTFIKNTGAQIVHEGFDAYYCRHLPLFGGENLVEDTIYMPEKEKFYSDLEYYSTLLHELTHWSMTKDRTNRVAEGLDYATEELVAEIGSAFLCAHLGISKTPRKDHAKYLNAWIQKIEDSEKALTKAFTLAQKSLDCLIEMQVAEEKVA